MPGSEALLSRLSSIKQLKNQGFASEALTLFEKHEEHLPKVQGAFYLKGTILQELGHLTEAIEAYKKELMFHPRCVEAHINLGVIYFGLKKFNEAIASFKIAVLLAANQYLPYFNLANVMQVVGRHKEAIVYYERALHIKPNDLDVLINLAPLYRTLGFAEKAKKAYEKILTIDDSNDTAKHFLATLHNEPTQKAPEKFIERLFDEYAADFDKSLTEHLRYSVPKKLSDMILMTKQLPTAVCALDLGCGTGLGAQCFAKQNWTWTGVDLSQKMLDKAEEKQLYQTLIKDDVLHFMSKDPTRYDLIIAFDTLPYLGELGEFFKRSTLHMKDRGILAISAEVKHDIEDYGLSQTGRFYHASSYIESLAHLFKLDIIEFEETTIRYNQDRPVEGALFVMQKH